MNKTLSFFQGNNKSFEEVLKEVQSYISTNHSNFSLSDNKEAEVEQLKMYISKYLIDNKITVDGCTIDDLKDKLYQDMAGFSFLTPYLYSKEVEEININSWEDIKIKLSNGKEITTDESFSSPTHALDVVRRLLQTSNMILDYSNPIVRGHLLSAGNVRITAYASPVVDSDIGVVASIRIINPKRLGLNDLINYGTANQEILETLKDIIRYSVSVCISGSTDSGKTTLLDSLLRTIPDGKRIFTIENNVREFSLIKKDEYGRVLNNAIHTVTKESENPKEEINQEELLEYALTSNPDIIVVGEMKSAEAFSAQEAARTGHGVLTTIHANSCGATYGRMVSLCKSKYDMKDETLYNLVTEAFPIIVFTKKLEDNSRKIMEITECEILASGERKIKTLFKYEIEDIKEKDGEKEIIGDFRQVNTISKSLQKRLLENGMPNTAIQKLII